MIGTYLKIRKETFPKNLQKRNISFFAYVQSRSSPRKLVFGFPRIYVVGRHFVVNCDSFLPDRSQVNGIISRVP